MRCVADGYTGGGEHSGIDTVGTVIVVAVAGLSPGDGGARHPLRPDTRRRKIIEAAFLVHHHMSPLVSLWSLHISIDVD
ncbi:hypothetical protein GCM10022402_23720 [Salinactinospora qingdaonensis]|uniref:Uncharacterized protein n=1 Tax=Salinactinospora qingdaonensis TaxID=702744 RepID=A0ABP7FMS5_9ACTN